MMLREGADPSELTAVGLPDAERLRLAALYRYHILDTAPEPQFDRLVKLAARVFDLPMTLISFIGVDRQWLKAKHGVLYSEVPRCESFGSVAIAQDGVMLVPDATLDPRLQAYAAVRGPPYIRGYAGAPLVTPEGFKIGIFCVFGQEPRTFSKEDVELLESLAAMVMDELKLRRANMDLNRMAMFDALTGLPNRVKFQQHLAEACRRADASGKKFVLGRLDLDQFKRVNDTFGHAAGDTLLSQVAQRLKEGAAGEDMVARVSGDEFVLLLTDVQSAETASVVAGRLEEKFTAPFLISARQVEVHVRWSLGMSIYPDDARGPDELLSFADAAMYRVKRAGGGHTMFQVHQDRSYSAAKTGHDDVTAKHADEAMPDVQSLLLERRDVTPDAGEVLASLLRSEASGDLALHAPRAYIAFSLVVVEGDALVVEEAQHRLAVLQAPQGQVASRRLFRSAPSPRDRGCRGIGQQSSVQQGIEAVFERPHEFGGDRPILLLVVHQAQRVPKLPRPHLSVMLGQTAQFPQQVCPAQRMFRGELEIRAPGVVHQKALELRQDVHGLQRGEAPLGMVTVQGELRAAHDMHPLELAVHFAASLVSVQDGLLKEGSFELCFEVDEAVSGELEVQDDGAVTGTRSAERFEDLRRAFQGHEVCHVQVDRQSMNPRSVLHLTGDMIWERCMLAMPTPWTDLDVRAVLGHLQTQLGQVMDLPCHLPLGMDALPRMSTGAVPSQR
jgi:diguanylate cyclase (GGDEF)-like protein